MQVNPVSYIATSHEFMIYVFHIVRISRAWEGPNSGSWALKARQLLPLRGMLLAWIERKQRR